MNIYCEDLVNRYNEVSNEELENSVKTNPELHKMLAALISLRDLQSDNVDLNDWECQLGSMLGFGVIDVL